MDKTMESVAQIMHNSPDDKKLPTIVEYVSSDAFFVKKND